MTTIAWKDGVLAADTATNFGCGMIRKDVPKIIAHEGRLAGAAGSAVYCQQFLDWFRAGEKLWDLPKVEEADSEALIIDCDGSIRFFEKGGFFITRPPFIAIGSGGKYAMAAMQLRHTAVDAVRTAMELDPFSGGEITVLRLGA